MSRRRGGCISRCGRGCVGLRDAHLEAIGVGQAAGVLHLDLHLGGAGPAAGGADVNVAVGVDGHTGVSRRGVVDGEGQVTVGVLSVVGIDPQVNGVVGVAIHRQLLIR